MITFKQQRHYGSAALAVVTTSHPLFMHEPRIAQPRLFDSAPIRRHRSLAPLEGEQECS
jgi:hypothetical protein